MKKIDGMYMIVQAKHLKELMIAYFKWLWTTASPWQRRNYIWLFLLVLTFFSHYLLPTLVMGIVLVVDAVVCAIIDNYRSFCKQKNEK